MTNKLIDPNAKAEGPGIYGLPFKESECKVIYIPVPWEATTSYGAGTAKGPDAISLASSQVDLFDLDFIDPYSVGFFMKKSPVQIKKWNLKAKRLAQKIIKASAHEVKNKKELKLALKKVNDFSEKVNQWVYSETQKILNQGKIPIVIGGGHSTPFGAIKAYAQKFPQMGILHFDAHSDTRKKYMGFEHSHASIMYNVLKEIPQVSKLVQVGIRDFCQEEYHFITENPARCKVYFDQVIARRKQSGENFLEIAQEIADSLPKQVYISIDIDGLDPKYCPNTGTPVPGGLEFQELLTIVYSVFRSGREILGLDLVEVAPGKKDEWDANVGSRLLYKMTALTLASQKLIDER